MTEPVGAARRPLRSQQLAGWAYAQVNSLKDGVQNAYAVAVADLGATILSEGLCAALAWLMRRQTNGDRGAEAVLEHIRQRLAPNGGELWPHVTKLDRASYMQATREALLAATWLKRAVQAAVARRQLPQPAEKTAG